MQIAIEDSDYNVADLQFTADLDNLSHIDSSTSPSGWKIKGSSWKMINHQYDTSFGKLKPKHHIDYSRPIFSLDITNEDMRIFIHILVCFIWPHFLFLACFLSLFLTLKVALHSTQQLFLQLLVARLLLTHSCRRPIILIWLIKFSYAP